MKHEEAVKIVNEMVANGFKLVRESADEFATRYGDDLTFLHEMLENVKGWKHD